MTTTLTLTDDQIEILANALMSARRDQRRKLDDALTTLSDSNPTKAAMIDGFRERIARLEEVAYLLPQEG